jgi:hypothetical protein
MLDTIVVVDGRHILLLECGQSHVDLHCTGPRLGTIEVIKLVPYLMGCLHEQVVA